MISDSKQQAIDVGWMRYALNLAHHAQSCGEVPVGAVIIRDNEILGEGWNQPISLNDPSAHAEIIALRHAGARQLNYRFLNTTLYVTLEPCIMCLGAIIHARIKRLVFGARDPKAGSICSAFHLLEKPIFNHHLTWEILQSLEFECSHMLTSFFLSKRKKANERANKYA